jgi:hypothetical protein
MSEQQPGLAQPRAGAQPHDVEVGQICLARPDRGADVLVLVTEVHEDHVEALLCSHEHHLATETDCVLDAIRTAQPGRLLVHGDVAGRVMKRRLRESLGRVSPELVERIALRGRGFDFNSSDLGRGPAITEADPRWEWKLDKFSQMRTIKARASELGWSLYKLGDSGPRAE